MDEDEKKNIRESFFVQNGTEVLYREQLNLEKLGGYAGELRGYYPEGPRWKPPASRQGMTRPSRREGHGGVDIYAPYQPFPCEIPVYAFVAGWAEIKSGAREPNDAGNRILLTPQGKNLPENLPQYYVLAHLNRFNGRFPRKVKLGEIIGYAGYSGNAGSQDDPPENSNVLNINSGHVHIQAMPHPVNTDPLEKLGWKLRYDNTTDPNREYKGKDISFLFDSTDISKIKKEGYALNEKIAEELKPKRAEGILCKDLKIQDPQQTLRKPTDPPSNIDYINKDALIRTKEAYENMKSRLNNSNNEIKKKYRDQCGQQFLRDSKEINRLIGEMKDAFKEFKTKPPAPPLKPPDNGYYSTRLLRFLFSGCQLFYLLIGGQALAAVASGPEGTIKGKATDCGIGIWGETYALAIDHGVAALHNCHLRNYDSNQKKFVERKNKLRTLSISFGAGTEWHAILDDAVFSVPASIGGINTTLAKYADDLAKHLLRLNGLICKSIEAINDGRSNGENTSFGLLDLTLDTLVSDIIPEIEKYLNDSIDIANKKYKNAASQKEIVDCFTFIAQTSFDACDIAINSFENSGQAHPAFKPAVTRLWLS